jgi:hypothetical protein
MQRTMGNRAVGSLISQSFKPTIQRTIDIAGAKFEDAQELITEGYGAFINTPLKREIVDRLARADYEYESETQLQNEVNMRVNLIRAMHRIHEDNVNVGYNHGGDTLKLPSSHWDNVEAKSEKGGRETDAAFKSKNLASDAIESIFADKNDDYFLECNTATVAMHYKALLDTIGQANFDGEFPEVVIMPEWLTLREGNKAAPSQDHIPETRKVTSVDDLVPGDWVYFLNFEDYPERHPDGAFTGENALYLGDGKYRGFGVDEMTFEDMVSYLIAQYNHGKGPKKRLREDSPETLDGKVPGITKDVRRMAENENIRELLK